MLINAAFGKIIPTEVALLVTALLIGGSMLISVLKTRGCRKSSPVQKRFKVGYRAAPLSRTPARNQALLPNNKLI